MSSDPGELCTSAKPVTYSETGLEGVTLDRHRDRPAIAAINSTFMCIQLMFLAVSLILEAEIKLAPNFDYGEATSPIAVPCHFVAALRGDMYTRIGS